MGKLKSNQINLSNNLIVSSGVASWTSTEFRNHWKEWSCFVCDFLLGWFIVDRSQIMNENALNKTNSAKFSSIFSFSIDKSYFVQSIFPSLVWLMRSPALSVICPNSLHRGRVWCLQFLVVNLGMCTKFTLQSKCRCARRTLVGVLADMGSCVFH